MGTNETSNAQLSDKRIAIIGLYNSGSTVLAGMLHRLGVNMGPPFWMTSDENHHQNFYEPWFLAIQLRQWWTEPDLIEKTSAAERIAFFARWTEMQHSARPGPLGAKHPLLSLCVSDLISAWSPGAQFIWAYRSFDDSVAGLARRQWFKPDQIVPLQTKLWNTLHALEAAGHPLIKFDWNQIKSNPIGAAQHLASTIGLQPTEHQLRHAAAFVRPNVGTHLAASAQTAARCFRTAATTPSPKSVVRTASAEFGNGTDDPPPEFPPVEAPPFTVSSISNEAESPLFSVGVQLNPNAGCPVTGPKFCVSVVPLSGLL